MVRLFGGASRPVDNGMDGQLSPKRGSALGQRRRRCSSTQTTPIAEPLKAARLAAAVKLVSPASTEADESCSNARALYGNRGGEQQARGSGLYHLSGQLLLGCYIFVVFHTFLLQFYPEVFLHLRYPPSFGHPLMLLPQQGSVWGWFFSYINGSIQQFVMRGVLGSLILICLLHLVRVVLYPIASAENRRLTVGGSEEDGEVEDSRKRIGLLRRLLRTAWSAQLRFHRRRERFCARLVALVCLGLTVIQTTSFFFGGWTLKAIGFPDIYLGALTKPGGLWGHETATDVVMQYTDVDSSSLQDLKDHLAELEQPRNNAILVLVLVVGFALDAWGQYLQVHATHAKLLAAV